MSVPHQDFLARFVLLLEEGASPEDLIREFSDYVEGDIRCLHRACEALYKARRKEPLDLPELFISGTVT